MGGGTRKSWTRRREEEKRRLRGGGPAGLRVTLEENGVFIYLHMMEGEVEEKSSPESFPLPLSGAHPLSFSVYLLLSLSGRSLSALFSPPLSQWSKGHTSRQGCTAQSRAPHRLRNSPSLCWVVWDECLIYFYFVGMSQSLMNVKQSNQNIWF